VRRTGLCSPHSLTRQTAALPNVNQALTGLSPFVMPIAYAAVSAAQWSRQAAQRRGSCPLAYSGLCRSFAALGISRNRYVLRQNGGGSGGHGPSRVTRSFHAARYAAGASLAPS
jgi:hypothetical protein